MKIIDLSHTIENGLITYKGFPAPIICDYLSREQSRNVYEEGTEFQIGKIVDFNYTREALSRILKVSREPEANPSDPLDVPYWGRNFMEWNDEPGRKKEDVIDALKSAADLTEQLAKKCK